MPKIYKNCSRNSILEFYLDCIENRSNNKTNLKISIIFYSITFIYVLVIFEYILSLFIEYNSETKLLLFDLSQHFGGNQKLNKIYLICILSFGLSINIKLHHVKDADVEDLVNIFHLISGRKVIPIEDKDIIIVKKMNRFAKIVFKLFQFAVIYFG